MRPELEQFAAVAPPIVTLLSTTTASPSKAVASLGLLRRRAFQRAHEGRVMLVSRRVVKPTEELGAGSQQEGR